MEKFAHDNVVPYKSSSLSKKEQVAEMFNSISKKYDFLNRFLSVGIDNYWRHKALNELKEIKPKTILDVATGTADVAIMAERKLNTEKIIGIDISEGMLEMGRKKIDALQLDNKIQLFLGDSEAINYPDNSFDAVTVAFGVRNFQNLEEGLREIRRVLKPDGKLVVLEFSKPNSKFIRFVYNIYMKLITPNIGKLFSKNKSAYSYLDASIKKFPEGNEFKNILDRLGYLQSSYKPLSFGICSIYCAIK